MPYPKSHRTRRRPARPASVSSAEDATASSGQDELLDCIIAVEALLLGAFTAHSEWPVVHTGRQRDVTTSLWWSPPLMERNGRILVGPVFQQWSGVLDRSGRSCSRRLVTTDQDESA